MSDRSDQRSTLVIVLTLIKEHFTLVAAVIGAVVALFALIEKIFLPTFAGWASVIFFVLALFIVYAVAIEVRNLAQKRKLDKIGRSPGSPKPGYFRATAYRRGDKYSRPDGYEREVLRWFNESREPVLHFTGGSGVGKSSLLNAYLVPKLEEQVEAWHVIIVRSFERPDEVLRERLLQLWKQPPEKLSDLPLSGLIQESVQLVESQRKRLLIVFDQFEELIILHEAKFPSAAAIADLLQSFRDGKFSKNCRVLLTYRSEYKDDLIERGLGDRLRDRENWFALRGFTLADARVFFQNSGKDYTDEMLDALIDEARVVDGENRGIIRPIVLNLIGMSLGHFTAKEIAFKYAGALLTQFVREKVLEGTQALYRDVVLQQLITRDGTKMPRLVSEIVKLTGIKEPIVKGVLRDLEADDELVRRFREFGQREDEDRWEVSHDFVARLLANVFKIGRREKALKKVGKTVPYVAVAALLIMLLLNAGLVEKRVISEMGQLGFDHIERQDDVQYFVINGADKQLDFDDDGLKEAAIHLRRMRSDFGLDLTGCEQLTELNALAELQKLKSLSFQGCNQDQLAAIVELESLTSLDLSNSDQLTKLDFLINMKSLTHLNLASCSNLTGDLKPLTNLKSLTTLDLYSCSAIKGKLKPLEGLTSLTELSLWNCFGLTGNLEPLEDLTSLTELNLSGCYGLTGNLEPLEDLTSLTKLYLSQCRELSGDLKPLAKLKSLTVLHLKGCAGFRDFLMPLTNLTSLRDLALSGCIRLTGDLKPLGNLTSLTHLDLTECVELTGDLKPLAKLKSLSYLTLVNCKKLTGDLKPLAELDKLEGLKIRGCEQFDSIAPIMDLPLIILQVPKTVPPDEIEEMERRHKGIRVSVR